MSVIRCTYHNYKIYLAFIICLLMALNAPSLSMGQAKIVPTEDHSRLQFAQTYYGLSTQYIPAATLQLESKTATTSPFAQPRLVIGGPHFWGLMDFYISIPVSPTISLGSHQHLKEAKISTATMTGLKLYPFYVKETTISPFLGVNWSFFNVQANVEEKKGPLAIDQRIAVNTGLTWVTNSWNVFELSMMYTPSSSTDYYINKAETTSFSWPGWSVTASYKRMLNLTRGTPPVTDLQEKPHLNAWHIGIGPSSAQSLSASDFIGSETPFMNNPVDWKIYPEISLGYYLHNSDMDLRFTYRPMRSKQRAFEVSQEIKRDSFGFELYKNLFDYHGFVPFVGPSVAYERYRFQQSGRDIRSISINKTGMRAGIVLGWDIRPNRYQPFILRTNVRYYPTAGTAIDGINLEMNTLEVNFIQLVVFPQRLLK